MTSCGFFDSGTSDLIGPRWQLKSVLIDNSTVAPPAASWIEFFPEHVFQAHTGCNGHGGEYSTKSSSRIDISVEISTYKLCPDLLEFERTMIDHLRSAGSFEQAGGELRLYRRATMIMVFSLAD
ncbi:META domain-containing protein [Rhodothermus sp. AH-315-K08]|nr:META domain-containing protein [Rhodothermus sp. AH-315-K08]